MGTTITPEHAADVADQLCRLTGEAVAQARTEAEAVLNTDGAPSTVVRDLGELLEMLQLGASRLRRVAEGVR